MEQIIIIGGGIGGLTAGALLSSEGKSVTVLESSGEWGGCAGKFERKGFLYPVGATLGMGFEEGGIHLRILRHLGLQVEAQPLQEVMRVHLPEGRFPFWADREGHLSELTRLFPHQEAPLKAFYQEIFRIAGEIRELMAALPILPPVTVKEWASLPTALKWSTPSLLPYFTRTVEDLLRKHRLQDEKGFVHFLDGQLIDSMQTTSQECSLLLGALSLDIYHHGAFYLPGGLYRVAEALVASIEKQGGALKRHRQAVSIRRKEDHWEVRDQKEDVYEVTQVVYNGSLPALEKLLDPSCYHQLSPRLRTRIQTPQWGAFSLYLTLEEKILPPDAPLFQQILVDSEKPFINGNHLFLSLSQAGDLLRAPQGYRTLTVSTHTPIQDWQGLDNHEENKQAMVETMLKGLEIAFPNLRQGLVSLITGSPRAWERFTLRRQGEVGGYPQTRDFSLFHALSHRSGLPGFWLCGDSIFPGGGTLSTSLSGYHVFHSITGKKLS